MMCLILAGSIVKQQSKCVLHAELRFLFVRIGRVLAIVKLTMGNDDIKQTMCIIIILKACGVDSIRMSPSLQWKVCLVTGAPGIGRTMTLYQVEEEGAVIS